MFALSLVVLLAWPDPGLYADDANAATTLGVMTLNIAHGRGDAFHQVLLSRAAIERNLDKIAEAVARADPQIVALQETDESAWWSGRFNEAAYIAERVGFPYHITGRHMDKFGLLYGTALVSRLRLNESASYRFSPSMLTPPKGFVVAAVAWPGCPRVRLNVVSVHLEFFRDSVQRRQARELVEVVRRRPGLVVLLGDFNTGWADTDGVLAEVTEKLSLHAYRPAANLVTLPRFNRRVDWILISNRLRFAAYDTLPEVLSDHRAVAAEIALAPAEQRRCAGR
jgi:endonuclease/exonuclease/phosphatase family metal-dependent hydrolase